MQGDLLIDISRLLSRLAQGHLPTGVDRVCLAYADHWGHRARAVVQKGSWRRILSPAASQELFGILRAPQPHFRRRVNRAIARALASGIT